MAHHFEKEQYFEYGPQGGLRPYRHLELAGGAGLHDIPLAVREFLDWLHTRRPLYLRYALMLEEHGYASSEDTFRFVRRTGFCIAFLFENVSGRASIQESADIRLGRNFFKYGGYSVVVLLCFSSNSSPPPHSGNKCSSSPCLGIDMLMPVQDRGGCMEVDILRDGAESLMRAIVTFVV